MKRIEIDRDQEVARNIQEGWDRIEPWVMAEEGEMERRLARRGERSFRGPLRAFCVAIRANDHRIGVEGHVEHVVRITDELVERACAPYHIGAPGEPADAVARKLGCRPSDLRRPRRSGELRVTPKQGLMGRRGRPVPVLYKAAMLDSTAQNKRGPHEMFGTEWIGAHRRMPAGFSQTVMRVPRYKWYERFGRDLFQGWQWICPCCRQRANILYYPQAHPDLAVWWGWVRPGPWGQQHAPIFACQACHGVTWFTLGRLRQGWNQLVLHYSGGLLYGSEVEKPAWLKAERTRKTRLRPESARRLELKRLLVTMTLSYEELGGRLGMSAAAADQMARRIYKREGVKDLEKLREKLGGAYVVAREGRMAG